MLKSVLDRLQLHLQSGASLKGKEVWFTTFVFNGGFRCMGRIECLQFSRLVAMWFQVRRPEEQCHILQMCRLAQPSRGKQVCPARLLPPGGTGGGAVAPV